MEKCPICAGEIIPYGGSARYSACRCCRLALTRIPQMPAEEAYPARYYGREGHKLSGGLGKARALLLGYRLRMVMRAAGDSADILDIGCGDGKFLEALSRRGYRITGTELPGPAFEAAKKIPGIRLVPGGAAAFAHGVFDSRSFSVITLWHVLEHLKSPLETLTACGRWLRGDGTLFVEVPNICSLQAAVFGREWFHLDHPRHLFHFSPRALKLLLSKAGFTVVKEEFFSPDMGFFGVLQSAMNLFIRPRNRFYDFLRGQRGAVPFDFPFLLFFAVILSPLAAVFALVEALIGRGAVIRYTCKPAAGDETKN